MKMQHVTITTKCIDESVEFYQTVAGLNIERDMRSVPEHKIVFLSNASGETCVELSENTDASFAGSGISIGFAVDDAEAYREKLIGLGMEVGEMISPAPVTRFFYTKDPNGLSIQFIQED